jgi:molybdopterin molybdotransferase
MVACWQATLPHFANSSMDGFAVRAADTHGVPSVLRVVMDIPAGIAPSAALQHGEAARIMTGAMLPDGADAVIPVEATNAHFDVRDSAAWADHVTLSRAVNVGDSVRQIGEDVHAGERILTAGTLIGAAELGMLSGLGYAQVEVIRQPRVAIISTGDELLGVEQTLVPAKIRDSNTFTLYGLIRKYGGEPLILPRAADTLDSVRDVFQHALSLKPDIILSSGGVSVGAFDVVRTVIDELGAIDFWRVNLRPGKPLAFGHVGGIPFFGLPGNPVSAMITFEVFVRFALYQQLGRHGSPLTLTATLAEPIASDGRRSYLRVRVTQRDHQLYASLTGTQSSGALSSMANADALLILPEGVTHAHAGEQFPIIFTRSLQG